MLSRQQSSSRPDRSRPATHLKGGLAPITFGSGFPQASGIDSASTNSNLALVQGRIRGRTKTTHCYYDFLSFLFRILNLKARFWYQNHYFMERTGFRGFAYHKTYRSFPLQLFQRWTS
jgi:hypothetical protein